MYYNSDDGNSDTSTYDKTDLSDGFVGEFPYIIKNNDKLLIVDNSTGGIRDIVLTYTSNNHLKINNKLTYMYIGDTPDTGPTAHLRDSKWNIFESAIEFTQP